MIKCLLVIKHLKAFMNEFIEIYGEKMKTSSHNSAFKKVFYHVKIPKQI